MSMGPRLSGADGALIGSRFLATPELLVPRGFYDTVIAADGDSTIRTTVIDVVRGLEWPKPFTGRALKTRFVMDWHGREEVLTEAAVSARENKRYWQAFHSGDAENTGIFMGEVVGLIRDIRPAGEIVREIVREAERLLGRTPPTYIGAPAR